MSIRWCVASLLAALVLMPSVASAQSPSPSRSSAPAKPSPPVTSTSEYVEKSVGGDQVVTFTGDELTFDGPDAYGGVIRPVPGVVRVALIRPRMNFVVELLKSVENL